MGSDSDPVAVGRGQCRKAASSEGDRLVVVMGDDDIALAVATQEGPCRPRFGRWRARPFGLLVVLLVGLLSVVTMAGAQDLRLGISALPRSADPHFGASRIEQLLHSQIYEGLADTDGNQHAVPRLAERWERAPDGTWLFHLRRNVRFQNGRPFTARDVVYSFCRTYGVANSARPFASMLSMVDGVEAPDPFTIVLRLRDKGGGFPVAVATIPIVSAPPVGTAGTFRAGGCEGLDGAGSTDFADPALGAGTGPFRLTTYAADHIVTVRNPDYWDGAPAWDRFELVLLPDEAKVRAMMQGRVDILDSPPPEAMPFLKDKGRFRQMIWPSTSLIYMQVNTRPQPETPNFSDPRLRRALVLAIPRGILAQRVLGGAAVPTGQMALNGSHAFASDIPDDEYDPVAARRLLAEAGYPNGFKVTILAGIAQVRVAQVAAHFLANVGINAVVHEEVLEKLVPRLQSGDFQIFCAGWIFNPTDLAASFRNMLGSADGRNGLGLANYGGYANPALDQLLVAAPAEETEARDRLARQLAKMAYADTAWIPLVQTRSRWILREGLQMDGRLDRAFRAMQVRRVVAQAQRAVGE